MVEATAAQASTCGNGPDINATADTELCVKSDKTYDVTRGDITMPLPGNETTVSVCDASLYIIGQFIQFSGVFNAILNISGKNGNVLTLKNACPDGSAIIRNPDPGTPIPYGSAFHVVNAPPCYSSGDTEEFDWFLAGKDSLCMPNLGEAVGLDYQQITGWVESNEVSTSFQKCIKRVRGVFAKAGSLFLKSPTFLQESNISNMQTLYRDKTTGQVMPRLAPSDRGYSTNKNYIAVIVNGKEIMQNGYLFVPLPPSILVSAGSFANFNGNGWTAIGSGISVTHTLSGTDFANIEKNIDYYAVIRVLVAQYGFPGGGAAYVKANDEVVGFIGGQQGLAYNSFEATVKVLKSTNQIKFEITDQLWGANTIQYAYRVDLIGLMV